MTVALSSAGNRGPRSRGIQSKACIGVIQRGNGTDGCGPAGLHARRLSLSRSMRAPSALEKARGVIKEFRRGGVLSGYPRRDSGGNGVGKTGWSPRGSAAKNACNGPKRQKKTTTKKETKEARKKEQKKVKKKGETKEEEEEEEQDEAECSNTPI